VFPSFAGAETSCKIEDIPGIISEICTVQRLELFSHLKGAMAAAICLSCVWFTSTQSLVPTGKGNVFPRFAGAETCCKMKHLRGNISDICTV
jgi:hypothetical protein